MGVRRGVWGEAGGGNRIESGARAETDGGSRRPPTEKRGQRATKEPLTRVRRMGIRRNPKPAGSRISTAGTPSESETGGQPDTDGGDAVGILARERSDSLADRNGERKGEGGRSQADFAGQRGRAPVGRGIAL